MTTGQLVEWVNGIHVKGFVTKVEGDTFDVKWDDEWEVCGYNGKDLEKNIVVVKTEPVFELNRDLNNASHIGDSGVMTNDR